MGKNVKFISSDGWELSAPKEVACRSLLIKNLMESIPDGGDEPIALSKVSGFILEKVIEYATEHKDDPLYKQESDFKPKNCEDISEWDKQFMEVDQGTLFELVKAANYLNMSDLLDLGCKTVAKMIRGKSVEDMRKTFNIENDFTPEEEERIIKENRWCEGD